MTIKHLIIASILVLIATAIVVVILKMHREKFTTDVDIHGNFGGKFTEDEYSRTLIHNTGLLIDPLQMANIPEHPLPSTIPDLDDAIDRNEVYEDYLDDMETAANIKDAQRDKRCIVPSMVSSIRNRIMETGDLDAPSAGGSRRLKIEHSTFFEPSPRSSLADYMEGETGTFSKYKMSEEQYTTGPMDDYRINGVLAPFQTDVFQEGDNAVVPGIEISPGEGFMQGRAGLSKEKMDIGYGFNILPDEYPIDNINVDDMMGGKDAMAYIQPYVSEDVNRLEHSIVVAPSVVISVDKQKPIPRLDGTDLITTAKTYVATQPQISPGAVGVTESAYDMYGYPKF